jgi:hypothetical protein
MVPVGRVRIAFLSSLLLLWTTSVPAGTVAVVQLPTKTPDLTETLSRLHGELLSVGLEVRVIDRPASRGLNQADLRAWLQERVTEDGLDAVLHIIGDTTPTAVDVWVVEKSSGRLEVSRVALEPNTRNASEMLSIRSVEVLRSTFLENDMAWGELHRKPLTRPATTTVPLATEHDEPANHLERLGVEVGAAALTSLDGVGPAVLPMAGVDWRVRPWFAAHAEVAGLGTRPSVAATGGSARVTQQYALLGGHYRFHSNRRLSPILTLSAGVLHTLVEGQANAPGQGHDVNQWSFLWDLGLGTELRLAERYYLTLAAHVQVANPYVAIHITNAVVGTTGFPNLVLTLTVGAWL